MADKRHIKEWETLKEYYKRRIQSIDRLLEVYLK